MEKIVLTTDFSADSIAISSYAINLYGDKINYILLTGFVCDYTQAKKGEDMPYSNAQEFSQYKHDLAMQALEVEKSKLLELFPTLDIKTKAIEGMSIRAIESATRIYSPDLVVIGTSRLDKEPSKTYESVATRLMGTLHANILAVPRKYVAKPATKILYSYDHLEMNHEVLAPFKYLIKKAKREVTFYHVVESENDVFSNESIEDVGNYLEIKNLKIENEKSRHVVESILTYCENEKPDLLVVIAKEETYNQDFWIGSKVDELVCQLRQPMLALFDAP